jgi:hypothetical protein
MTTLLLAPTESRPASPALIPETSSLAELNRIKHSWIQAARDLGYPENIWQVVYWLGSKVRTSGLRECQVWQSGEVAIIANEYPLRFIPELNTDLIRRSFGVWLADGKTHPARANPGVVCRGNIVDDILFSSNLVARWAWLVAGTQIEEVEQELLFLPGRWLNPVLAELGHARQAAQQSGLDATEAKRRKLLAEMLVGLEV